MSDIMLDRIREAILPLEKAKEIIFKQPFQQLQNLPCRIECLDDYSFEYYKEYSFIHSQDTCTTLLGYAFNRDCKLLRHLQEELKTFKEVLDNISKCSFNLQYLRKLKVIESPQPINAIRTSPLTEKYHEFVRTICKLIYRDLHIDPNLISEININEFEDSIDSVLDNHANLLRYDLFNDSTLVTIISLSEIIDNITDGEDDEPQNCIVLSSHSFVHPYNWLLSPAALAVSFFNYQMMEAKISEQDSPLYTKSTLPGVTYLSLSGIFSDIDLDFLHHSSDNIQTIVVYDENTGGADILNRKNQFKKGKKLTPMKKDYQTISDKILLLPLECTRDKSPRKKEYCSNDLLQIVENFVVPSIKKFKPSYIVLNCSLIFDDESNQTPFSLTEEALAYIIHLLCQIGDSKVIVYPFKLGSLGDPGTKQYFAKASELISSKEDHDRLDYIMERYGVPYNEVYLRDCIVSVFEVLSDQQDRARLKRQIIRKSYGNNPLVKEMAYQIGKYYKQHPYYSFLYSKSFGTLSRVSAQGLISLKDNSQETNNSTDTSSSVFLFVSGGDVRRFPLKISGNPKREIVFIENSRYLVDYNNTEQTILYIFNARLCEEDEKFGIKISEEVGHFRVSFQPKDSPDSYLIQDCKQIKVEDHNERKLLRNFGLCQYNNFIFQVYGTEIDTNQESNTVLYYDFEADQSYFITIPEDQRNQILPRRFTTPCLINKDGFYYLYIFGGQSGYSTMIDGKSCENLDNSNSIEVYYTDNLRKSQWMYKLLPRESSILTGQSKNYFNFYQSFAFYDQEREKISIMGGKNFENSVYNWVFPVFEFDVNSDKLTSFDVYLNHTKDNLNQELIQNHIYRSQHITTAITNLNQNIYYDRDLKLFRFIIPFEQDDIVCLYTYSPIEGKCDYVETQIGPASIQVKITLLNKRICQVPPNPKPIKPIKINPRIATIMAYSFPLLIQKKIWLELVNWRLSQDQEIIGGLTVEREWDSILGRVISACLTEEEKSDIRKTILTWSSFREFEDIFRKKDNRLEELKNYLSNLIYQLEKMEKILENREQLRDIERSSESIQFDASISDFQIYGYLSFDRDPNTIFMKNPDGGISISSVWESKEKGYKEEKHREDKIEDILDRVDPKILEKDEGKILENDEELSASKLNQNFTVLEDEGQMNMIEFEDCITFGCPYQAFFNVMKNGLTISVTDRNGNSQCKTVRFKVISGYLELEDISFCLSPSSVTFFQGVVICYISPEFKRSHPHLYEEYENWILFANLKQIIESMISCQSHTKYVLFKKIFNLSSDEPLSNGCLLLNQENLFMFVKKYNEYKEKGVTVYRYNLFKNKEDTLQISLLEEKDTKIKSGDYAAVSNKDYIFACQRENAQEIEIFNADGTYQESIRFDFPTQGWNIHMNLVNIRGKDEILITVYAQDKDTKLILFDFIEKIFEEKVVLVPKNPEEVIPSPMRYSGYELLSDNVNKEPVKEIGIYNMRGDDSQVIMYKIQVGDI